MKSVITLVLAFMISTPTEAAEEEQSLGMFDTFCIQGIDHPHEVPDLVEGIGATALPATKAKLFLAGVEGRAWLYQRGGLTFILSLTQDGVCSMYFRNAAPEKLIGLFEKFVPSRLQMNEGEGMSTDRAYTSTSANGRGGDPIQALVWFRTSNLLPDETGVMISSVPRTIAEANGIITSDWP